jgi:hypothetical protein
MSDTVYLFQCCVTHRLKVGYTSGDPVARLRRIRSASPTNIKMIALAPGCKRVERRLHKMAQKHRIRGGGSREWFEFNTTILDWFQRNATEYDGVASVPREWREEPTLKAKPRARRSDRPFDAAAILKVVEAQVATPELRSAAEKSVVGTLDRLFAA